MAYNNPIDTKVDLTPALLARLHGEGLIVAVKEFTGDVRRAYEIAELAPGLDILVGSDDVTLEVVLAGAVGWVSGYPNAFREACMALWNACLARDLETALPLYRRAAPVAALGLQDRVRPGDQAVDGPRRPLRRRLPPAARTAVAPSTTRPSRSATESAIAAGCADARRAGLPHRRVPHRGDADPGRRRRGRADPRRHDVRPASLTFLENSDDLRTLLMYEPRGHASMSGAILQPPTRPDADWGVLYIEVSGCLPMCGHGTIGVATVLVETGMVEVTEPETTIRLDTPAGLVDRPGRRRPNGARGR